MAKNTDCRPACCDLLAGDLGKPLTAPCLLLLCPVERTGAAGGVPQSSGSSSCGPPPPQSHGPAFVATATPCHGGSGPHIRASLRSADCPASCWVLLPPPLVESRQRQLRAPPCCPTDASPGDPTSLAGGRGRPCGLGPGIRQWQAALGAPTGEKVTAPRCVLTLAR